MRYVILITYAVIFLFSADLVNSDTKGWIIRDMANLNNRYGVLTKLKGEETEIFLKSYFVKWKDTIETSHGDFDIVDSQFAMGIQVCDTNAFSYVIIDSNETYLTVSILSPELVIDTLIEIERKVTRDKGWLYEYTDIFVSLRDSIIIGRADIFPNEHSSSTPVEIQIQQLLESGKLQMIRSFSRPDLYFSALTMDFSQMLFNVDSLRGPGYFAGPPFRSIALYDFQSDSLITFRDSIANIRNPKKRTRTGSLFYLRAFEGTINLWKALPDGTRKQLTYLTAPSHVEWYHLRTDSIEYVVRDNFAGKGASLVYFIKE